MNYIYLMVIFLYAHSSFAESVDTSLNSSSNFGLANSYTGNDTKNWETGPVFTSPETTAKSDYSNSPNANSTGSYYKGTDNQNWGAAGTFTNSPEVTSGFNYSKDSSINSSTSNFYTGAGINNWTNYDGTFTQENGTNNSASTNNSSENSFSKSVSSGYSDNYTPLSSQQNSSLSPTFIDQHGNQKTITYGKGGETISSQVAIPNSGMSIQPASQDQAPKALTTDTGSKTTFKPSQYDLVNNEKISPSSLSSSTSLQKVSPPVGPMSVTSKPAGEVDVGSSQTKMSKAQMKAAQLGRAPVQTSSTTPTRRPAGSDSAARMMTTEKEKMARQNGKSSRKQGASPATPSTSSTILPDPNSQQNDKRKRQLRDVSPRGLPSNSK